MTRMNQPPMDEIMESIDRAVEPVLMSPEEALEFLQDLQSRIEGSIDGLKDDIKNAEAEDE
jgi:hypothetical protein